MLLTFMVLVWSKMTSDQSQELRTPMDENDVGGKMSWRFCCYLWEACKQWIMQLISSFICVPEVLCNVLYCFYKVTKQDSMNSVVFFLCC
ncbi:unnamed protein product [Brassica oleracea]